LQEQELPYPLQWDILQLLCSGTCMGRAGRQQESDKERGRCYLLWTVLSKVWELPPGQTAEHLCSVNVGTWLPVLCTPSYLIFLGW